MEFVLSEKSKPLIIYDGYKFRYKTLQDDVQRWPCCFKNCKCFIKLSPSNIIVESNTNHEHSKPDKKVLNRQIMSNSLKRKALVDISCKPSKLIRSELKQDMKTNALHFAARCFGVKNQWNYMLTVIFAVMALGYLIGRYSSSAAKTYSGTELAASTTAEISVQVWQRIQSKIEEIAGELQDLQAYMGRQKFHVPNAAKR